MFRASLSQFPYPFMAIWQLSEQKRITDLACNDAPPYVFSSLGTSKKYVDIFPNTLTTPPQYCQSFSSLGPSIKDVGNLKRKGVKFQWNLLTDRSKKLPAWGIEVSKNRKNVPTSFMDAPFPLTPPLIFPMYFMNGPSSRNEWTIQTYCRTTVCCICLDPSMAWACIQMRLKA